MPYVLKDESKKDESKKDKRKAKRKAKKKARKARRQGIFSQFKDERKQHRQNAGPLRKIAGIIPAAHLTYLLRNIGNNK